MHHNRDLTQELMNDHRAILALFDRIHRTPIEDADRERLLRHATAELARHTVAERLFLFPLLRTTMEHGDTLARQEAELHDRLTLALTALAGDSVRRPGFDGRIRSLEREVKQHIRHDEHDVFPALRQVCPHEDLARLGSDFHDHAVRHHADVA